VSLFPFDWSLVIKEENKLKDSLKSIINGGLKVSLITASDVIFNETNLREVSLFLKLLCLNIAE
jgi:hypothetical protein